MRKISFFAKFIHLIFPLLFVLVVLFGYSVHSNYFFFDFINLSNKILMIPTKPLKILNNKIVLFKKNTSFLYNINNLINENNELRKSNATYKAQIIEFENISNTMLKNKKSHLSLVRVEILSVFKNFENSFLIFRCNSDKIKPNMIVVDRDLFLIGKITTFSNNIGKIEFLTSSRVRIPILSTESNIYGISIGNFIDKKCPIIFDYNNDRKKSLVENEIIATSGEEAMTARGVLVGNLKIKNNDKDKSKKCIIPFYSEDNIPEEIFAITENISSNFND